MAPKRLADMPELPTFKEAGVQVEVGSQRGLGAPAGISPDVAAALSAGIDKMVADPEFAAAMAASSLPIRVMTTAAYAEHLRKLEADLRDLWATHPWK
jgi:tripartite-type tricarboxylate transporter receptor subunit TctC